MRVDEERVGDVTILTLRGDLDARTVPDVRERLDELIKVLRLRVVFNLSEMEVITSTSVSFFVDSAKRLRRLGGDALLSHPPRLLERTLNALRIADFFRLFPDDDAAVRHFQDEDLGDTVPSAGATPPGR